MDETGLIERVAVILRALEITEIRYSLNGGGDSGEVDLDVVCHKDGHETHILPVVPVAIRSSGEVIALKELLDGIVAAAPEGDWVNNEGGYGTVCVRPFADDEEEIIECDMTFRDEDEYDDEDDDGFVDDEDPDDDPDDDPPSPASPSNRAGEVDQ